MHWLGNNIANSNTRVRQGEQAKIVNKNSKLQVAILTSSDRAAAGAYADLSGPALRELVTSALDADVAALRILPDDREQLAGQLRTWADTGANGNALDLILVTGGTGFAPRDVTPEATRDVIEKEAPGLAEVMRMTSLQHTPHAMLSRAVCGIRGRTLIINLPGSPRGATENLRAILPALPHAIALLREESAAEIGHSSHTAMA
ncbi:MAG: Molybdopterin adenylyltransferase [Chloroflexi bacterium ADurb.Bin360]|nr:MAG: Molybdopterin adenylyltransferase [Chloroflexi bacterium ADurb.Bin360]